VGDEPLGRVAIIWPAAKTPPSALPCWGVRIDDLETGEQILDALALDLRIGSTDAGWSDKLIEVVLTRLVDAEGKPIGGGPGKGNRIEYTPEYAAYREQRGLNKPHTPEEFPTDEFEGPKLRTAEFRYVVAEMGVNLTQPGIEPKLAVGARVTHVEPGHEHKTARELLDGAHVTAWGDGSPTDECGRAIDG
jgi:hypothetical protein